jgi:hypothetical protein
MTSDGVLPSPFTERRFRSDGSSSARTPVVRMESLCGTNGMDVLNCF